MDAATLYRIVSLVPERAVRLQSGAAFAVSEKACAFPERIAFLAAHLQWLSPLSPISKDDRRLLGFAAQGRPPAAEAQDEAVEALDEPAEDTDSEAPEEEEESEDEGGEPIEIDPIEDEEAIDSLA